MGKKVLVIDDDPVGGMLMESRLLKEGYEVFRALNGEQGFKMIQTVIPSIIILDVEMPGMNGYMVVSEVQKLVGLKDIPIIVLTAHEENKKIFARRGISNYMVKPVDFNVLFPLMTQLVP